ncbi:MAG: PQQ-dependent sugar dehydrogenase, partial [Planctomycetaceae bacterium]
MPKDELGSWVCIAFDNKGRLLTSDQGDKGICRITLPPVDARDGETKVERLDFSKCDVRPTAAQGMLLAFDSLYFSINGGPGSGLYRARDTDGDDQFDQCVKLKDFRGGGEHGPHALRLSPDGQRIFVICGNHTKPPFDAGEELTSRDFTSRIPTNWSEDHLLPRMWDANGHAVGIMAPGGWIASTDADGKTWDLWSMGYRNPYDMAFNADGELFAYDADMEWDVGSPWYRPTRVVHATSGSEFGWRSGSGKWPTWYPDSLPQLVNIGPGSPVGVDFGYGCRFPAKYQKALYLCDWTFGTMYAIHLEPRQSSYTGVKEEFLSRTPLPLTDVTAGPDGALYFSVGGRGTQSELFRVIYTGDESTESAQLKDPREAGPRSLRRLFESFHAGRTGSTVQSKVDSATLLQNLASVRGTTDRFLRTATHNAFYNSQLFPDLMRSLDQAELGSGDSSVDRTAVAMALAKAPLAALAKTEGLS